MPDRHRFISHGSKLRKQFFQGGSHIFCPGVEKKQGSRTKSLALCHGLKNGVAPVILPVF